MPSQNPTPQNARSLNRWYALGLATLGMFVTFTLWTGLSPIAPLLQKEFSLSHTETSLIIAIPVLLGSVMRIPIGVLTDRFGGKTVFLALLTFLLLPALALGTLVSTYSGILLGAFFLGLAGTSFAIGVPYVSRWFPPQTQGLALGLFGMGNGGTAIAAYFAPRIAQGNWHHVFLWFSLPLLIVGLLFLRAPNLPDLQQSTVSSREGSHAVWHNRMVWLLSFDYFLTFGSFVAFANYIPKLVSDMYVSTSTTGGNVAAVFVIMSTLGRPCGGWLSDRLGGIRILQGALIYILLAGLCLAFTLSFTSFTLLMFGFGFITGIGNGAVFKLVAQHFRQDTGIATGIVGAAGGLGGFFPPLLLGVFRDSLSTYTHGFLLLSALALACTFCNTRLDSRHKLLNPNRNP